MSIGTSSKLKELQGQLEKAKAFHAIVMNNLKDSRKSEREATQKITSLQQEIKRLTQGELVLSEHAILRYLERVELIPVQDVPGKILTEEIIRCWKILGNGKYPIGNTQFHAVIKSSTVITIS